MRVKIIYFNLMIILYFVFEKLYNRQQILYYPGANNEMNNEMSELINVHCWFKIKSKCHCSRLF